MLSAAVPVSAHARRRLAAVALAGSAALMLAAGCGSSGSSDGTGGAGGDGQNALAAYAACLKEQGIEVTIPTANPSRGARPSGGAFPQGSGRPTAFPSGQPSGQASGGPGGGGQRGGGGGGFANQLKPAGVDEAAWTAATTACADSLPQMGNGGQNGGGQGGPGGGPGGQADNGASAAYTNCLTENGVADPAALNTADAATAKAVEACAPLKPAS